MGTIHARYDQQADADLQLDYLNVGFAGRRAHRLLYSLDDRRYHRISHGRNDNVESKKSSHPVLILGHDLSILARALYLVQGNTERRI